MELRIASTFHVGSGIITEDEALDDHLNIRLSERFGSTIFLFTPASKNYQLPKYS